LLPTRTTSFADTQHNPVALNFDDLGRNRVEVDVDEIPEL
jgi:hypothetical protein